MQMHHMTFICLFVVYKKVLSIYIYLVFKAVISRHIHKPYFVFSRKEKETSLR